MKMKHHKVHKGLQGHSVGEHYPLSIVGVGDKWQVWNLVTGWKSKHKYSDIKEAHKEMNWLKVD